MAEDAPSAARDGDGKRKYDEQVPNLPSSARRSTGFSSQADCSSDSAVDATVAPPSSLSAIPIDEIQAAKQRAQEIAARIFRSAEAKRPRLENGAAGSDESTDLAHRPGGLQFGSSQTSVFHSSTLPVPYGFQGSSKKIDIPNGKVGVIIGKSGETIKYLQLQSGAKIHVTRDMDADTTSLTRPVELIGTPEQITKAEQLINDVLAEAEAGSSGIITGRKSMTGQVGVEHFTMKVPNNKVGLVIGKSGQTIKNLQARSGAHIQLIPLHLPPGDTSTERTVHIDGTIEQIESAKKLVNDVIENHLRNQSMSGGYPQQGYRPPQHTMNWAPPGHQPMQQPGYGYMQPGAYPGPQPHFMPQPSYSGYPPQSTPGGYSPGWDQTAVPPNQHTASGNGYDYYSQQPQQQQQKPAPDVSSTPADSTTYNYAKPLASNYNAQGTYGEQSASGQQGSYNQDGYVAGYHAPASHPSYAQQQSNPQLGYDQQQTYNSAPAYGSMVNQNQDGTTASYGTQVGSAPAVAPTQPSNPTSHSSQGSSHYAIPTTSQPVYGSQTLAQTGYVQAASSTQPGYVQPQGQKPSNQAVYGQNQPLTTQAGYDHSQPPTQSGYVQQDSSQQRAPSAAYLSGAPPAGYGQTESHGAPPGVVQQSFGPQSYGGGSYGSGYTQPPVYSVDGSAVSGAPAAVAPSGVSIASPQG